MVEATFAGNANRVIDVFAGQQEGEFIRIGQNMLDSEELSETVYRSYLSLLTEGWRSADGNEGATVSDIGEAYLRGFYVPCCQRVVLAGQVDLLNDQLPDYAGIVLFNDTISDRSPLFVSVRKLDRLPRHIMSPPFARAKYAASWFYEDVEYDRKDRRIGHQFALRTASHYFAVMGSGALVPCRDPNKPNDSLRAALRSAASQTWAATLNAHGDRRHLWNVVTSESLIGASTRTPLVLGVSTEHVKSLFYARSAPMTATGRRRPILHWVQSHLRRIESGIDIDIERHLRGVSGFEMDGFSFEIVQPLKRAPVDR